LFHSIIQTRQDAQMVLAVTLNKRLTPSTDLSSSSYVGWGVSVQRKKLVQFGRANQRWRYDESSQLIYAFVTDTADKGINL